MFSTFNRLLDSFFGRPSVLVNPHLDCLTVYACLFGPISNKLSSAKSSDLSFFGAISDLFGSSRPAAIVRFVMTVIVNSVQLVMLRWGAAHVLKKIGVTAFPSFTDSDAAPAVSWVSVHGGVGATSNHSVPRPPFLCALAALGLAVFQSTSHFGNMA